MKIKVFSFTFNRPDLLQYQINSFKKFIHGDYDINVIYDTRDNQYYEQFKKICENNEVNFYNHLSQPGGYPSFYNAQSMEWAYKTIVSKEDTDCIVMFLDHDIFLIDHLNIVEDMKSYDIMGCLQTRKHINYVWPGLFMFKKSSIENIDFDFYPQTVDGQMLDAGGGTYKLLSDKNIKFLDTKVQYPDEYNDINLKDKNMIGEYGYELHYDGKFLHFRNASNWHNNYMPEDEKKTEILVKILGDFL